MGAADLTVDSLRVRVLADPGAVARVAAAHAAIAVRDALDARGTAHVMFASGNSQLPFLAELAVEPDVDWSRVVGFHMDEYVGVGDSHPAGFRRYMRERVAGPLGIGTFHALDGTAADPDIEADRYAALLRAHPIDVCCLGIGENGHLAFNDPPVADFDDPADVKVVTLDEACRRQQVNEGHFAALSEVPARAITVTIPALLRARRVLAVVPEARKAEPVRRALEGSIEPACPASALRRAAHATLYLDADSAALLRERA